ncbi:1-(5-phosphoribosyl)-5-[(5-phosphoribosylamino)methylideneamino]imidazole-4-carboxamide isomerase [Chiayiivirga flava]|uniref:1-(5-phosphoribosyl)-5-[(5-phosphoribosylamino)methylideneamino] imidazole-4-carboxamide isomerase n=1 Tax=Chiayiivirga flava TaxID=659595 RepID=A0A7W8D891_9GAMM|nr:1-(5-phosphoribosyl)-5-[(5-phosphoribosylamino)methylideneamino]imidazole-4-carboxamide isomerase [Chiayiivirga flava]MBB5208590.1 phosphoribosylformimino-5-aminoimidazole carboxamide ribotide isomerase [Chiayiivirga flava]
MSLTVYPAIDVREHRVVRLRQGDYAQETRYAHNPLELAQHYAAAGATWLHLVDLDAARHGGYTLSPLVRAIKATTPLRVQTGGGVRDEADVRHVLDAGADRVVLGSVAVRDPARVAGWIAGFGAERITVALDTRQDADGIWRMPLHGWTETSPTTLDELLHVYAASDLRHVLCTDIGRDGMLAGPNLALYGYLRERAPTLQLQASGGVRDVGDVRAAGATGCAGVVLGKALLDGRLDLREALAC